jgi:hypothetical protein
MVDQIKQRKSVHFEKVIQVINRGLEGVCRVGPKEGLTSLVFGLRPEGKFRTCKGRKM